MATNIGPKIGLDGEKEFRESIKDIIQNQKTLKSEMQAVSSAWDKNTSALKKNRETKEQLNKQIENQKKYVEALTKKVEEATAKNGENDRQTLKWKDDLNKATAELNRLNQELDNVPNGLQTMGKEMQSAGESLGKIGGNITGFGNSMMKSVTAPIVGVGAAAIAAFNDVDGGLDTIIVKTGATGESLAEMQGIMENIATTIPTDFSTAGEAVGEVNTRFGSTGKELEDLSKAFIEFASLNGTDVTGSIDSVQAAMQAFGVDSGKAKNVLDMLNKAGQNTGVSVDKLTSDLLANSATFEQMGFGINQSIGFLSGLNKNGLDSAAVMGGLSKALQNATKDGVPLNKALSDLQTKMASAESDTEAMQMAMELFGNKAGPKLAKAIQEGALSFEELDNIMLGFSGSVESTFSATLDAPDQMKVVFNELKTAGADLGGVILETLAPAIEKLSELVGAATAWFKGLDDEQKETIVQVAGVVAAIGPLIVGVGSVVNIVGKVISIGGTVISLFSTIVSAINPVTLAIGAVVAAGVLVYQNWDTIVEKGMTFKDNIQRIWNIVKQKFSDAIDYIKGLFDFEWKFPDIKLPHFSIVGEFSLNPPSVPSLGVEWYAKAMDKGMILNRPTIFGAANGHFLGGGEAGAEVVVGANSLSSMIAAAVSSALAPSTNNYGGNTINVYGAPGQDMDLLARKIANIINGDVSARGAVWA